MLQICFLKKTLHKKEEDLALKDKQYVPKGRRPLPILNTNFYNKGNKFTNALGDYACRDGLCLPDEAEYFPLVSKVIS